MIATQILIGVASTLDRADAPQRDRHLAMKVREAIDLINGGEYRQFEFKGVSWTRLPSGKIVRGK